MAAKPKTKSKPKRVATTKAGIPPILKWALGLAAEAFGWGWLLMSKQFAVAAGLIYFGFVILTVDLWVQSQISVRWRAFGSLLLVACSFAFTVFFVVAKAPLGLLATIIGEHDPGTILYGITWRPEFTEVNLDIVNPTDIDYDDIDLIVRPTDPVADIREVTHLQARFLDPHGFSAHILDIDPSGNAKVLGLILLATDAGYEIRCNKIPRHDKLTVVMALADIKWDPKPRPPGIDVVQGANDPTYVLKIKSDDFSSYWFGHKEGVAYAIRPHPSSSSWIKVDGQYTSNYRRRKISQKIEFAGFF